MADVNSGLRKQGQQANFECSEQVHIILQTSVLFSILYTHPFWFKAFYIASCILYAVFYSIFYEKGPSICQFCLSHLWTSSNYCGFLGRGKPEVYKSL